MTARHSRDSDVVRRVRTAVSRRLGVDARALAAFRAALAALVLADIFLRARFLTAFYTDAGVLPRSLLYEQYGALSRLSLHALSGAAWVQGLLFGLAVVTALSMLVGYRTTLATLLSGVLLTSLHYRNPLVLNSGDTLLRMLFLWGVFLPLGRRWSVDALHASTTEASGGSGVDRTARNRVVSVATAGVLLQVVVVYATNAVLKLRGDRWLSGDATRHVLELDMFTVRLGDVLAQYPTLLTAFDRLWLGMLVGSVLLVALTGWVRAAFAGLFAAVHLGMLASMQLGLFPLVSVAALVPFLPAAVWDELPGWRAIPGLRDRPVSRSVSALASGLPDVGLPDSATIRAAARWKRRVLPPLLAVLLVGVLAWNAATVGIVAVPDAAPVDDSPDPRWGMFAPTPAATDYWVVAPGTLDSGDSVDAFRGGEVTWTEPPDVARSYPSARWRKYVSNLRSAQDDSVAGGFADYLCTRHESEDPMVSVSVFVVEQPVRGENTASTERVELAATNCSSP
ncbi:HTTM domain-containing protein [Halobacterium bonnevillei]|uniref:HTTM domain-containing protein n=1 Tax=Halobacterium bonnevillei TaxID=2692200 RepID=UPI002D7EC611|nr:HTTM domain-containing protein [Halobacterium bonnevillei]